VYNLIMLAALNQHRVAIGQLCRRYAVARLELFGSAGGATFDPARSDIDLLVLFARHEGLSPADQYLGLLADLQQLFGRKVDLVDIRGARNPYFLAQALKQRHLLYAA
jgi:predicted nucleotidyltransferase